MQDKDYKKMVLRLDCGVGMNSAEFFLVPVTMSEEELDNWAWESAINFAQGYGIENTAYRPEYESEEEEEADTTEYSDDISGWFELYNSKEHDGLSMSGTPEWQTLR